MITSRKINLFELLLGIFIILIPFNNLPYLHRFLKELSYYASSYPMLILMIIMFFYIIKTRRIKGVKDKTFYLTLIFVLWSIISGIVNVQEILTNSFKGVPGIKRFVFQFPLLVFGVLVAYIVYYIISENKINIYRIRTYVLISALIAGAYSIFEVLYHLNLVNTTPVLRWMSNIVQYYSQGEVYVRGVRSVTGEASYFGMYVAFLLPWLISYIYTEKTILKKSLFMILNLYFIALIFLSKSRLGLIVFFFVFTIYMLGILVLRRGNRDKKILSIILIIGTMLISSIINKVSYENNQFENTSQNTSVGSVVESLNDKSNKSNLARFSLLESAIEMGNDNPVFGVGIGQFGFSVREYMNEEGYESEEIKAWLDPKQTKYWPTVFSMHGRIYAETGIVGFIIWISIWAIAAFRFLRDFLRDNNIMQLGIFTMIIGVVLGAFNLETFIYYPLWIVLGIIWAVYENKDLIKYGDQYE